MSTHFSFAAGELDAGKGLVFAPGRTRVQDVIEAGWRALDAQNGWESFATDKLVIWRHSFAVSARFRLGSLAQIDCIWKDGSIRKQDWSATDDDLLREKKTLAKLIKESANHSRLHFAWGRHVCVRVGDHIGACRSAVYARVAQHRVFQVTR